MLTAISQDAERSRIQQEVVENSSACISDHLSSSYANAEEAMWGIDAGWAFAVIFFAAVSSVGIYSLRKKHSHEIYLIWYIFSFFFVLFLLLELFAGLSGITRTQVCGSYEQSCQVIYHYLTDFGGEFLFVTGLFLLTVAPQLLAYFLSALSGSASPPRFISQAIQLAVWSLVKFCAAYAGILLATIVAQICLDKAAKASPFSMAVLMLSVAFSLPLYIVGIDFDELPEAIRRGKVIPFVRAGITKFHAFCSRNAQHDGPSSP